MLRKLLISVLGLALLGLILLPALAYTVGQFIIGPYEGSGGLAGYIGVVLQALRAGAPSALILVASPLGVVVTWYAVGWLLRRPAGQGTENV